MENESQKDLSERFEAQRNHLRSVAYRLLGSLSEAEDAVQETWLRLSRSDQAKLSHLGGWLTTVVARICLDMLRARKSRREVPFDQMEQPSGSESRDPSQDALLADAVGVALLVVLERLSPAERVAFVLHDLFELPFDDIAGILGRSTAATRQLASRARRRVKTGEAPAQPDTAHKWKVVDAFLAASRSGNLEGLLELLDPQVVYRADPLTVRLGQRLGIEPEVRGAEAVAEYAKGLVGHKNRVGSSQPAWIDGEPGMVVARQGRLMLAVKLLWSGDRIAGIQTIAEPEQLGRLDLKLRDAV